MESQPNFCLIWIPKDTKYVLKYKKVKYFENHLGNKSEVNEQIQHCGNDSKNFSDVASVLLHDKLDQAEKCCIAARYSYRRHFSINAN